MQFKNVLIFQNYLLSKDNGPLSYFLAQKMEVNTALENENVLCHATLR